MNGRRFFSSTPTDANRSATRTAGSGPFQFNFPIDSLQNLSQNIINSVNSNPVISNLMSGARTNPLAAAGPDVCDSCQTKFTVFKRRVSHVLCVFVFPFDAHVLYLISFPETENMHRV
jgi:hypothetical protein